MYVRVYKSKDVGLFYTLIFAHDDLHPLIYYGIPRARRHQTIAMYFTGRLLLHHVCSKLLITKAQTQDRQCRSNSFSVTHFPFSIIVRSKWGRNARSK